MHLFGVGPLRQVPDAEYLQTLEACVRKIEANLKEYRREKRPAWMIRNEETSLVEYRRAISALRSRMKLAS